MVTKPKLYFYDCGLVAYLTKWSDSDTLMNGAMSGAILENLLYLKLSRVIRTVVGKPIFITIGIRILRRLTFYWKTVASYTPWKSRKRPRRKASARVCLV